MLQMAKCTNAVPMGGELHWKQEAFTTTWFLSGLLIQSLYSIKTNSTWKIKGILAGSCTLCAFLTSLHWFFGGFFFSFLLPLGSWWLWANSIFPDSGYNRILTSLQNILTSTLFRHHLLQHRRLCSLCNGVRQPQYSKQNCFLGWETCRPFIL